MIYVRHTGLLHSRLYFITNHPEQITTLQQNDCKTSRFPVTLWPWANIKFIQTGIKLSSLVVSSIIEGLKQIDSQVFRKRTLLIVLFY